MARIKAKIELLHIEALTRLPDGSTKPTGVELDNDADRALLERILAGEAPPPGTALLNPPVDLAAQLDAYLLEGNRNSETQREIQLAVQKSLAHVEQAELPAVRPMAIASQFTPVQGYAAFLLFIFKSPRNQYERREEISNAAGTLERPPGGIVGTGRGGRDSSRSSGDGSCGGASRISFSVEGLLLSS